MHAGIVLYLGILTPSVAAHGYVQQILFGDSLVDTWNPYKDPQKNVVKITRKFLDNGPVTDGYFTVCLRHLSKDSQRSRLIS